jgi:hypothetical protein
VVDDVLAEEAPVSDGVEEDDWLGENEAVEVVDAELAPVSDEVDDDERLGE